MYGGEKEKSVRQLVMVVLMAGVAIMPAKAQQIGAERAAEQRVWEEEHARWNAEQLSAARRLEAIAAMLKSKTTSLDEHGRAVRDHGAGLRGPDGGAAQAMMHAQLRAWHAEERVAHHDMIDDIDALEQEVRKEQGRDLAARLKDKP